MLGHIQATSLLLVFLFTLSGVCHRQDTDDTAQNFKQTQSQLNMESKVIAGQPISYIDNVLTVSSIVRLLGGDGTASLHSIRSEMVATIAKQRQRVIGMTQQEDSEQVGRDGCMICHKGFRNSDYLAVHYVTRHYKQLQGVFGGNSSPGAPENVSILQQILGEPFFQLVNAPQLQILTSKSLPAASKFQYCMQLALKIDQQCLANQNSPNQYLKVFSTNGKRREFCLVMASRMWVDDQWAEAGNYLALVVAIFVAIGLLIYCLQTTKHRTRTDRTYKNS